MSRAFWLVILVAGCSSNSTPAPVSVEPTPISRPGLHNVFRVTDRVYSGNSPEGAEGFRSLKELGIQTVLSVDGTPPDLAAAKAFGLRYVHLPIGYDGISESRLVELAKALRDSPGPIYVHCHHGMHRGPAATIAAVRCLDANCSAAAAVNFLKQAGTDPKYSGLFAAAERTPPKMDEGKIEFPELADIPDLTRRMVQVDETWDHLRKTPTAKDATLLVEHFREIDRATKQRNEDFRKLLADAQRSAEELEKAIRERGGVTKAVQKSGASCTNCHAKFRDRPVSSTP